VAVSKTVNAVIQAVPRRFARVPRTVWNGPVPCVSTDSSAIPQPIVRRDRLSALSCLVRWVGSFPWAWVCWVRAARRFSSPVGV